MVKRDGGGKNKVAQALGKKGDEAGAALIAPERRPEIARKAVKNGG